MTAVSPERRAMLAAVHVHAAKAGLGVDAYRDKLELLVGLRSAKDCTDDQLRTVLDAFNGKQKRHNPYTRKVLALFLSAFNLGAFDNGSDKTLDGFVERQTGKLRLAFITAPEANKITEALKEICTRHGFTVPEGNDPRAPRAALLMAQWRKLHGLGVIQNPAGDAMELYVGALIHKRRDGLANCTIAQLDQAIASLGQKIRNAMKQKAVTG